MTSLFIFMRWLLAITVTLEEDAGPVGVSARIIRMKSKRAPSGHPEDEYESHCANHERNGSCSHCLLRGGVPVITRATGGLAATTECRPVGFGGPAFAECLPV